MNSKSVSEPDENCTMRNVKNIFLFLAIMVISNRSIAAHVSETIDLNNIIKNIPKQKPKAEIIFTESTEKDGSNAFKIDRERALLFLSQQERSDRERLQRNNDDLCNKGADGIVNGICYKLIPKGKNEYEVKCGNFQTSIVNYYASTGEWCNGLIAPICNKDLKSVVKFICSK